MQKLEGITVNGIPLSVEKADDLDTKKTSEIELERRETISSIPPKKHKVCKTNKNKNRAAGLMYHLTDQQIRKEYGLMSRPFNTNTENIIWAIMNLQKPSTPKEIAEIAGYKGTPGSLSSILSSIYFALEPAGCITREEYGKTKKYFPVSSSLPEHPKSIEYLYPIVRRFITDKLKDKKFKLKQPTPLPPIPSTPEDPSTLDLMTIIKNAMEKALGIKVEVSGKVEVVFKVG